jgi:hypothetical protein
MRKTVLGGLLLFLAAAAFAANPAMPVIPSTIFNVTNYGAIGDGSYDNTTNLQAAINAANAAGGGVVEVPAGTFLSGPITLLSSINLRLDAGAMLQALPLYTYPGGATNAQTFVGCNTIHDLEISGTGTIDGQGAAWWAYNATNNTIVRPMMLNLYSVNRLFIHDVTFQNPANHHCGIRQNGGNITISNLTVNTTNNSPNTDGLNFVGTNCIIENCHISDGDDNIAMGSTGPIYDLLITNCTFGYGHGVSIGSGIDVGITNLTVINCTFNNTGSGIRIKCARDNSHPMQNLNYLNLTMTNVNLPIVLYSYYDEVGTPDRIAFSQVLAASNTLPVNTTTPMWRDITFSNINIYSPNNDIGGVIWGPTELPITNVTFIRVTNVAPKTFFLYNVHNVKVIDSVFNFGSSRTFTLCNADVTVSNSVSGPAVTLTGTAAGTNAFALYNTAASLTNADGFGASPVTISGSTLAISNNFLPAPDTVFNFVVGTNSSPVAVKGNLVLAGTNNILAGAGFTNGTYLLMTNTGTVGGVLPVLGSVPSGYNCTLNTNTAKQLRLVVTSTGPQPPSPPTDLAAAAANSLVTLTWSPSATATNYNIKRSLASGGPYAALASTANTNYSDVLVTNGTTYFYVVSAVNTNGEGLDSAEVSALPQPPQTVTNGGEFSDNFTTSTLGSATPAAPTPTGSSYELLSSKTWTPPPSINTNHLIFGIPSTISGCVEVQALFTNAPVMLVSNGDTITLTVTFTNRRPVDREQCARLRPVQKRAKFPRARRLERHTRQHRQRHRQCADVGGLFRTGILHRREFADPHAPRADRGHQQQPGLRHHRQQRQLLEHCRYYRRHRLHRAVPDAHGGKSLHRDIRHHARRQQHARHHEFLLRRHRHQRRTALPVRRRRLGLHFSRERL